MSISFSGNHHYNYQYGNGLGNNGTDGTSETKTVSDSVTFGGQGSKSVSTGEKVQNLVIAASIPELESSLVTLGDRNVHHISILSKLNSSRGMGFNGRSIMFDIYAMMDLIQEMSQKMRNALRELRKLENTAIYANIKAQAEIQRSAAMQAMIAGAVMCAVQVAGMAASLGVQLKGFAKTSAGKVNSGTAMMEKQQGMIAELGHPEGSAKQLRIVENRTPGEVRNAFAGETASRAQNNPMVKDRQTAVNNCEKTIRDLESIPAGNRTPGEQTRLDNAKKNLPELKQDLARAELGPATEDVQVAQNEFNAARNNYNQALETVNSGGKLPPGTSLKDLKGKFMAAGQKYELAQANRIDIANRAGLSPKEMGQLKTQMQEELKEINPNASIASADGQAMQAKGMLWQMVVQAIGQFGQTVVQGIKEIQSSKATELMAEQKLLEEQFDQIKDLFALQLSVIQKSIDIFAGIIQKESSVIEQIFQHI